MNLPHRAGPATPELDFRRFAVGGDLAALDRALVRVTPGLAAAARRIAAGAVDADDLLQETLLRAIRRAPSFDARFDLAGWLFGILRHVAHEHHAARLRVRPSGDDAEYLEPHDVLAQKELQEAIAAGLASVPERYREPLRLRLLEGCGASEIAAATGEPVATVRSRLQRGLRMLREALPVGLGALLTANLHAAQQDLAPPRTATLARRSAGTVALLTVVICAALLVALVVRGPMVPSSSGGVARVQPPPTSAEPRGDETAAAAARRELSAEARVVVEGRVEVDGGTAGLRLCAVRVADDTLPISCTVLCDRETAQADEQLRGALRDRESHPDATVEVGGDGAFSIALLPGRYALDLADDRRGLLVPALVTVRAGDGPHDLGVLLGYLGRTIQGQVPAEAQASWAELYDTGTCTPRDSDAWLVRRSFARYRVPLGDDGRFVFRRVWPEGDLTVVAGGGRTSWLASLAPVAAGERREVTGFAPAMGRLEVRVPVASTGERSTVEVSQEFGHRASQLAAEVVTFAGLLPGRTEVRWLRADGVVQRQMAEPGCAVLTLAAGARVHRGVVVDASGAPVAGATVMMMAGAEFAAAMSASTPLRTDANGRFAVAAAGTPSFVADAGGGRLALGESSATGEVRLQVPTLREVRGRVLDPTLAGSWLAVYVNLDGGAMLAPLRRAVQVGQDLCFVVRDVPAVPVCMQWRTEERASDMLRVDAQQRELAADLAMPRLPELAGVAIDAHGRPIAGALVGVRSWDPVRQENRLVRARRSDCCGRFRVRLDGACDELVGWTADRRLRGVAPVHAAGEVALRLVEVGAIDGRVIGGSRATAGLRVAVIGEGPVDDLTVGADGRFSAQGLLPGRYQLLLLANGELASVLDGALARGEVEVVAGGVSEVALDPGTANGVVALTLHGSLRGGESVVLCAEDGMTPPVLAAAAAQLEQPLPAGRYRVAVLRDEQPLGFGASVEVVGGETVALTLTWTEQRWNGVVEALAGAEGGAVMVVPVGAPQGAMMVLPDPDGRIELCGVDPEAALLLGVTPGEFGACLSFCGRCVGARVEPAMARVSWRADLEAPGLVMLESVAGVEVPLALQVERGDGWCSAAVPAAACVLRFGTRRRELALYAGETRTLALDD